MLSPVMCTTAGFDLGRELASLLSTPVKAIHPVADRPKALRTPFSSHKPRILILYGSLRTVAYSRLLAQEVARLLKHFGCEVQISDPADLPLPDAEPASHPKVQELRELSAWSEGQVWISPER